jgi:hypothetical protein
VCPLAGPGDLDDLERGCKMLTETVFAGPAYIALALIDALRTTRDEFRRADHNRRGLAGQLDYANESLDAILQHAHEIVCRIPGGIHVVDNRGDVEHVVESWRHARELERWRRKE